MDIVERLRKNCTCNFESTPCGAEEECRNALEAADEIERLREALRPFTAFFLYPDDLGFEASLDIKEDPDWDDDANDMQTENVFVLRRDVRRARAALKEGE